MMVALAVILSIIIWLAACVVMLCFIAGFNPFKKRKSTRYTEPTCTCEELPTTSYPPCNYTHDQETYKLKKPITKPHSTDEF